MGNDNLSLLLPINWREKYIDKWLDEDIPNFDVGGCIVGDGITRASLLCKSSGVLAGGPFFTAIFERLNCSVEWIVEEGFFIENPIQRIAYVIGPVNRILQGERVALNLLSRLSGIATIANQVITLARDKNFKGIIAGSRKTTPGLRLFEKYALMVGGCDTHRFDLSTCIMLKDNHVDSIGSITKAVNQAKSLKSFTQKIEVECRNLDDALEAANSGADIVMLDNFNPNQAKSTAAQVKEKFKDVLVEVSGGIIPNEIHQYLDYNIDIISMGSLTQGYQVVDFSLKVIKENKSD